MVALDCSGPAKVPPTCKVQVVCALSTDMALADVILKYMLIRQLILAKGKQDTYIESFRRVAALRTFLPLADKIVIWNMLLSRGVCRSRRSWSCAGSLLILA